MKLVHISTNLSHDGYFYPRIPADRLSNEDNSVKRICFSPSIEQCLAAAPFGGISLSSTLEEQYGVLKVFEIETADYPEIEKHLITPNELFEKNLVQDAIYSEEYWITTAFQVKPENIYFISVVEFESKKKKYLPFDFKELLKKSEIEAFEKDEQDVLICERYRMYKKQPFAILPKYYFIENLIYSKLVAEEDNHYISFLYPYFLEKHQADIEGYVKELVQHLNGQCVYKHNNNATIDFYLEKGVDMTSTILNLISWFNLEIIGDCKNNLKQLKVY